MKSPDSSPPGIFDYPYWSKQMPALQRSYANANPFPHIVIDNFFPENFLNDVLNEFLNFSANDWINYVHINERKRGFNRFNEFPKNIQSLVSELNSPSFVQFLSAITGIKNLLADESLEGGGLHESRRGGFLNIHADFVSHPHRNKWRRRVNLLIYLNKNWDDNWGGELELWGRDMKQCVQKIAPHFNRIVIFNTDENSYHGHPQPMQCPEDTARRSIALYYFTEEDSPLKVQSTHYRSRPQDKGRKWMIELDNWLLNVYTSIKRNLGINDKLVSRVLKFFSKYTKGNR